MAVRYEYHPENGDWAHVCVVEMLGGPCWFARRTRAEAEAKVAEMKARNA
jgi:hypothetical protein